LIRLLPACIAGICSVVFGFSPEPDTIIISAILPAVLLLGQVLFAKNFFRYPTRWLFGIAAHVLVFFFFCLLTQLKTEINFPDHFSKFGHPSSFMAYLDDVKQEKSKSYKTTLRIVAVKTDRIWKKSQVKCLVYFSTDSISGKLGYGDLIVFNAKPAEVKPPANPSQFNYQRWLSFNQVYHQLFLPDTSWQLLANHRGNYLVETAISMREKLLNIFKENQISGDDYAVVSALLLGDTDEINQEILSAYAASGALHVLSVSGLHVGIIYIAFSAVLFFLNRNKHTKILKAFILLLFLWYYALLTGLSPAVLRSAAMLSFIVLGKALDRSTNMYNTLAASAIVLLCYQPYLIMQVGFQLSYLAVFGIVFLYKKIHQLLDPSTWLWKQIWGLTAVSIAAQLATFPLGLFYFNQFPNYFLVSNLLVIPISTVILYGGIILFVISPLTAVSKWVGLILGKTVHLLNWTVITIEHLPYSLFQGISISFLETSIIYFSMLMFILYFLKKETKYVFASGVGVFILLTFQIVEAIQVSKQRQVVVFNIPKSSAINLIEGHSGVLITDSNLSCNRSMMMFNIIHYWWDCGLRENDVSVISTGSNTFKNGSCRMMSLHKNFLKFHDKRMMLLDDYQQINSIDTVPTEIDFLVLSKNPKIHLKELAKKMRFKQLIIDSSNSFRQAERWQNEAKQLGLNIYSVQHSGAYIIHF
jgi:competence protein ComEC